MVVNDRIFPVYGCIRPFTEFVTFDLGSECFQSYIKQQFNEKLAKLVCEELLLLVPVAFSAISDTQNLKLHIGRCAAQISDSSKETFYYVDIDKKYEILPIILTMIDKIRIEY